MAGEGLTRRAGLVALGRAAGTISLFAVNAILVRSWSATEVGAFSAIWVLSNTLVPLFQGGLPTSLLYFFPRRSETGRVLLVRHTSWCLLASGILLALVLAAAGPQLARLVVSDARPDAGLGNYLLPFLPYAFSLVAVGFAEPALVAAGRAQWQALLGLAGAVGLVAAAGIGAWLDLRVETVLALFSGVGLLRWGVSVWLVGRAVGRSPGGPVVGEGSGLGAHLRYACAIGLNDAVGGLSRSVDRLVVGFFFSVETFALYHLGAVEVPISLLLAGVATVMVPEVSRLYQEGDLEAVGRLWRQAVARLALVVLPLFAFLFCFAEPLVLAYLSASYARSLWVFRLFLLVLPLRIAVYNPLLVGMGRANWALWGGVGDLFLNLLASVVLVQYLQVHRPEWAFLGPALAAVGSTYVQVGVLVGLISRRLGLGLARLLPWGALLRVGASSAAAGLLSLGAASWVQSHWARLGTGGAVFAGLMVAALWLHPGDRRELRQVFHSLLPR